MCRLDDRHTSDQRIVAKEEECGGEILVAVRRDIRVVVDGTHFVHVRGLRSDTVRVRPIARFRRLTPKWRCRSAVHFFIAFSWAAIYYAASRKLEFLVEHPLVCGLFYGAAVEEVMNLIVLPLSALHARGPYRLQDLLLGLGVGLAVGLGVTVTPPVFGDGGTSVENVAPPNRLALWLPAASVPSPSSRQLATSPSGKGAPSCCT